MILKMMIYFGLKFLDKSGIMIFWLRTEIEEFLYFHLYINIKKLYFILIFCLLKALLNIFIQFSVYLEKKKSTVVHNFMTTSKNILKLERSETSNL